MTQIDHAAMTKNTKDIAFNLSLDRLSICYNEPNQESVKKTCGLLISDHMTKFIPGIHVTKNARYEVSCQIPFPVNTQSIRQPVCFEAGPRRPGQASFRLDFNPSKLSFDGLIELIAHLAGWIDADELCFFYFGKVTRCDFALDLPAFNLADVIVRTPRMRKHGVYSNSRGDPQVVYVGTPRSARRIAVYDKPNPGGLGTTLRLECRLHPQVFGHQFAKIPNPFTGVGLLPANFSHTAGLDIPGQFIADTIRIGGLRRALKVLDAPRRKALKNAYAAAQSLVPNLDSLWAKWPDMLVNYGLGNQLGAVPIKAYMAA